MTEYLTGVPNSDGRFVVKDTDSRLLWVVEYGRRTGEVADSFGQVLPMKLEKILKPRIYLEGNPSLLGLMWGISIFKEKTPPTLRQRIKAAVGL